MDVKRFVKIGRPGYKGETPALCALKHIHVE